VLPVGAAWRRLHAVGRLHAARVMPRPGLPQGVLLLTVYAPLQVRAQLVAREQFVGMMLEVVHGLDMQTPTLLMGDFNGSADPARDFLSSSGARGQFAHCSGNCWVRGHRGLMCTEPCWTRCPGPSRTWMGRAGSQHPALIWCWQTMLVWLWCGVRLSCSP
jgi:hypothetical protein